MIINPRYFKDPELWELWYIPLLNYGVMQDVYHQPYYPKPETL